MTLTTVPHTIESLFFRKILEDLSVRGLFSRESARAVIKRAHIALERASPGIQALDDVCYDLEELVEGVLREANVLLDDKSDRSAVVAAIRAHLGQRLSSNPDLDALIEEVYLTASAEKRFP